MREGTTVEKFARRGEGRLPGHDIRRRAGLHG